MSTLLSSRRLPPQALAHHYHQRRRERQCYHRAMSPFLKGLGLTGVLDRLAFLHATAVIWLKILPVLEMRSEATWPTVLTTSLALYGSVSV